MTVSWAPCLPVFTSFIMSLAGLPTKREEFILPPRQPPAFHFQFSHMTCSGQKNEKEKNMEPCFEFRFQRPLYVPSCPFVSLLRAVDALASWVLQGK